MGYDRAFLIAWFMFLIYISIFWANATSVPLFARYFLGGIFKQVYLFTVFRYDVYLGEALVTLAAMSLWWCLRGGIIKSAMNCS